MEYPKNFKKNVKNILGLTVDLRKKEFKELGKERTTIHLLARLREIPKYRAIVANRTRQITTQKKYISKRIETKKKEENAKKIQSFFKREKERNKLFKVIPTKC